MKKIIFLSFFVILTSCSVDSIVNHHGVHNLEDKQSLLKVNYTNKNDIIKFIGPPSTKSTFNNNILIYIERKTSSSKLSKLGGRELIKNDVLVLEINNRGILISKNFYNKDDMKRLNFDNMSTKNMLSEKKFTDRALNSIIEKIDDPLGKKRGSLID